MSDAHSVVTAVFAHHVDAVNAVNGLEARGFTASEISLLMSEGAGNNFKLHGTKKVPEGVAAGATGGGVVGALVGGLTAVGTIATGGAGLLIAGPLVGALAGAGAGAGVGGLIGGLVGLGVPKYEAEVFAEDLDDGRILVAVRCDTKARKETAERVFADTGAESTSNA